MPMRDFAENIILVELPPEPDVRKELDAVMETVSQRPSCDVIVDLSRVDILCSLSLSGFLKLHKLLNGAGRKLLLCGASSLTKDIFTVTCFDGIFEFFNDVPAAAEALAVCKTERQALP